MPSFVPKFLITIATMAIVILFEFSCSPKSEVEKIAAIKDRTTIPKLHATEITTVISDSGVTRYRISAPQWDVFDKASQPYWEFPLGVHFERFDENLKVDANIHSKYARYLEYDKLWELKGNVRMTNIQGELFETEHLFWNQNFEKIYSDTVVKITQKTHIIYALGFESNQQMTKYLFKSTTGIFPVEEKE
ncbi:MAG: LPS export ABC transporter periplasmic protein LptC [Porphyromonadaceae bacterium CG2_30_38_12]|nr:MAG: LPS export ABC transporter periplasmic protein LptC [Porphyromonadaceae bacterium CG2_30_38_12]